MRLALVVSLALLTAAACARDAPREPAVDCGLPPVDATADVSAVPEQLIVDGAEVTRVQKRQGRVIVALRIDRSVQGALDAYRQAVDTSGYRLLQEDNEVHEAELYLRRGRELAMIQIRRSVCDDQSAVFLNMPAA